METWKSKRHKGTTTESSVRDCCEVALIHCILEGVLKEEFHFTPYSTISYIGLGRKAVAVKRGMLKVRMRTARGTTGGGVGEGPSHSPRKAATGTSVSSVSSCSPTKSVKGKSTKHDRGGRGEGKSACHESTEFTSVSVGEHKMLLYQDGKQLDSDSSSDGDFIPQRKRRLPSSICDEDCVPVGKRQSLEHDRSTERVNEVIELDSD